MAEGAWQPNFEWDVPLQQVVTEADDTNQKDKHGSAKPAIGLIPPAALIYMAKAMKHGADKYGSFNWREKAVRSTIYVDAAMRHLLRYLDGEDVDTDSGVPHIAHVAACMAVLMDATACGNLKDDRPLPGPASALIEDLTEKAGE